MRLFLHSILILFLYLSVRSWGNRIQSIYNFFSKNTIELLKNSIVQFYKTTSIDHFHETKTDGELIFG
ncbi:hypothetical protein LBBP_01148 [Leptospira borgpetersenii serovar Ballum]|uniref:Uncharacterized protein n=2 Tax=Leptospira borgpetersenii TaxID=174 RepID=A0A0S2IP48_LEPBO|nr:hypothetical protein LBBP_01148 [Leptospira borgpetersenii serovar Ballum]